MASFWKKSFWQNLTYTKVSYIVGGSAFVADGFSMTLCAIKDGEESLLNVKEEDVIKIVGVAAIGITLLTLNACLTGMTWPASPFFEAYHRYSERYSKERHSKERQSKD